MTQNTKPFEHGQVIEYKLVACDEWVKGVYIAKHPAKELHLILNFVGNVVDRFPENIRHVKVKKEGWLIVYPFDDTNVHAATSFVYRTEELAKEKLVQSKQANFSIVKIEWEE